MPLRIGSRAASASYSTETKNRMGPTLRQSHNVKGPLTELQSGPSGLVGVGIDSPFSQNLVDLRDACPDLVATMR